MTCPGCRNRAHHWPAHTRHAQFRVRHKYPCPCPRTGNPGPETHTECSSQLLDYFGRRLDELDEHAFATDRKLVITFRVYKTNVISRCTLANTARRKAQTLLRQPINGRRQIVHPQADMIKRRRMYLGRTLRIQWLHKINLDAMRALPQECDVLVDIFFLTAIVAAERQPERIHPQRAQFILIHTTYGDLLYPEHLEWSLTHDSFFCR